MKMNRLLSAAAFAGVLSLSAITPTQALDVEIVDYECDTSLPLQADFQVRCDGSQRCTFGESTAKVSGQRKFLLVRSDQIR